MVDSKLTPNQQQLVTDNYNLIYSIVQNIRTENLHHLDREDVQQMALVYLCKAAMKYDESKGIAFSTFATVVIKNGLYEELATMQRHCVDKSIAISKDETDEDGYAAFDLVDMRDCYSDVLAKEALLSGLRKFIANFSGGQKKLEEKTLSIQIVKEILNGKTRAEICKELSISKQVCSRRIKDIEPYIKSALSV